MALFPKSLRSLFSNNLSPFGEVFPPKANPRALSVDGRTHALRLLKRYVCALTFYRPGPKGGQPIPFQIEPDNFHVEWPDHEVGVAFPSAVVIAGPAQYVPIGLTTYLEEGSRDRWAPGTVVQWQSEYTETFQLELWAAKYPERRSLLAGLEVALTPTEQMYGLRFRMRDYYDQTVCFSLGGRELMDDRESALDRRRARLSIEMRFNMVALVNYVPIRPVVKTSVDVDLDTNVPVKVPTLSQPR